MKMDGEYILPTNVENVWNNLNDPLVPVSYTHLTLPTIVDV